MAVRRPNSGLTQTRQDLELGRQIAVDLEPNADFDKNRRCPDHCVSFELDQHRKLGGAQSRRKRSSHKQCLEAVGTWRINARSPSCSKESCFKRVMNCADREKKKPDP
jgi:hypothetical protein